jgi:hypothetical protein
MVWSIMLHISAFALESSSNAPAATNKDTTVQASEVANALSKTDGVLADSSQIKTTTDSGSAIKAATAGATIDVPKDASEGVTLGSSNGSAPAIDISIPNADQAKDAKKVANGTVAYAGNNGSASAVQATDDGGVRMLTVIDNPNGGHIELTNEGGAIILDNSGHVMVSIEKPWAKDANGKMIQTSFVTNGQVLTQTVMHNSPGIKYPVTADPRFSWGWTGVTIYFNRSETAFVGRAGGAALSALGWAGIAAGFSLAEAANASSNRGYCLALYKPYAYPFFSSWWMYRC